MNLVLFMDFPKRLAALRKERQLTQQTLADQVGVHVIQIKRYEAGTSQPTLDVLRKLSMSLSVSTDQLVFGEDGRGPDDDLRLHFEAAQRLDAQEREVLKTLLEGLLMKHDAKHVLAAR